MADSRAQAYAAKLNLLVSQAGELSPEVRRAILKLLDDLNREILADLAHTNLKSYSESSLKALRAEVLRAMAQFRDAATHQVNSYEDKAYKVAAASVDATVAAGTGTTLIQPVIDRAALQVVQGYTADLIGGLTGDMGAKINAAIQRGYLGRANLTQLVEQIGTTLEGGKFSGLFSQVGEKAMSIATNEVMRIHSLASVARIGDLATRHPGLKEIWKHIPVALVPRVGHLLADGQIRNPGEPFLVEGEELMYPRDPSGSAENTINCHCLVLPHLDDDQLKPTDQERQLLKSYGLSVTTQAA
jgi:hypothetical protein